MINDQCNSVSLTSGLDLRDKQVNACDGDGVGLIYPSGRRLKDLCNYYLTS